MANDVKIVLEAVDKASEDIKKVGGSLGGLEGDSDKAKKGIGGLDNAFSKLITAGLIIKAGKMVKDFAMEAIQAASDVEEMSSKFRVVFGDDAVLVERELGKIAETINRSKYDLMGYASTLQDTFVPLGFAREEAAKMSVEVVKFSEDLASFNNLKTADVVRDMQSALVGNTMVLRKYGAVANEATIKQKALDMGLWDGTGAMSAQEKAAAILQIAMDSNADAMGDATNTAESYANQMRGAEAAVKDISVEIGNALMPVTKDMIGVQATYLEGVSANTQALSALHQAHEEGIISGGEYAVQMALGFLRIKDVADVTEEYENRLYENKIATTEATDASEVYADRMSALAATYGDVTTEVEDLIEAEKDLKNELNDLKSIISGPVSKAIDDFVAKKGDLIDKGEELRAKIEELESMEYLTDEQKEQLEAARADYAENQESLEELTAKHEESTARIIFGYYEQQAARDGLTEKELEALTEIGIALGIYDEETAEVLRGVHESWNDFNETGDIRRVTQDALDLRNMIEGIPRAVSIGIHMTSTGEIPVYAKGRQHGGPVSGGRPYLVGERGPEIFMPGQSGQIIPNQYITNYNLTANYPFQSHASLMAEARLREMMQQ